MGVPVVFAMALAVIGIRRSAMASAAMFCSLVLFGGNLGPLRVGALSDALSPGNGAESLRYALLAILAFLLLAAAAFYWTSRPMAQELEE